MILDIASHRFQVALSYPQSQSNLAERVFRILDKKLGPDGIFYDKQYSSRLAIPALPNALTNIYRNAVLVVAFLCSDYSQSPWCGIEWEAIRGTFEFRPPQASLLIRLDETPIDGLSWTHGYIDATQRAPTTQARKIAKIILERIFILHRHEDSDKVKVSKAAPRPHIPNRPNRKSARNFLILDALGQWNPAIQGLIRNSTPEDKTLVHVAPWLGMKMEEISEVATDARGETYIKSSRFNSRTYNPDQWLYVFVAPLPLAAKFQHEYDLAILGPAFSTGSDISIYVRPGRTDLDRPTLRIGVIDDQITSTIMLKTLLCLADDFLHPTPDSLKIDRIERRYECIRIKQPSLRLRRLASDVGESSVLDACIFTRREYEELKAYPALLGIKRREIITVDPPVAHFLGLDYVPRSVYFVHRSQFDDTLSIKAFLDWLRRAEARLAGAQFPSGMRPLFPWSTYDRNAQHQLVDIAHSLKIIQNTARFSFAELPT